MADAAAAAPPPAAAPERLDDLMLAMDVVDTLRHHRAIVETELSQGARDEGLKARLRELYASQGIAVPDSVILEGIKALSELRFVYTPPPPSLGRTLALAWVHRWTMGLSLGVLVLAVGVLWAGYQFGVVAPRQSAAEQVETDLGEALPRRLEAAYAGVMAEARIDAARVEAGELLRDGKAALARRDVTAARAAVERLETLELALKEEYVLRIVSRPGEDSGIMRVPDVNESARNFYLIVEAVAPDGRVLELPIRSEENNATDRVSKWGVRVSQAVFEEVARDKNDNGIIENAILGEKRRGVLEPDYKIPIMNGAITRW